MNHFHSWRFKRASDFGGGTMRKTRTRAFMGAAACLLALAAWAGKAEKGGKIRWGTDYDAARESARKSGKLLMVYFTSDH